MGVVGIRLVAMSTLVKGSMVMAMIVMAVVIGGRSGQR